MLNHHLLAVRLAGVLGLGAVSGIGAACGGKVVFDGGGGSDVGGSGPTGPTTTSSSTGSSCNVPPPAGDAKEHVCLAGLKMPCAATSEPTLKDLIATQLNGGTTGCGKKSVDKVVCGPSVAGASCCYDVFTQPMPCMGRPFVVDGVARTADVAERGGWMFAAKAGEKDHNVCPISSLDATTRRTLAEAWSRDALFEHASIASFAHFALELLEHGAPADLVRDAQRAMGDEIRHAELSFGLASLYAGGPRGPSKLMSNGLVLGRSLAEVAAATVREGCVNETAAALVAQESRDAATDPRVRAALTEIADDETTHAELAWRTVAWALSVGGVEVRDAVARAFAEASIESSAGELFGAKAALHAHGQLDRDERRGAVARAMNEVIRPTAAALLACQWLEAGAAGFGASAVLGVAEV